MNIPAEYVMGFAALEINSDLEQARDHAIDN
jgi:hypothetical protein